jgi:hypothetical protein
MSTKGDIDVTHSEVADTSDETKKLGLWQALKRWPKLSAYCAGLISAILLWGYDSAMAGNLSGLSQFRYASSRIV